VPTGEALGRATLVLMFVFSGAESAVALSGEVADPVRTIPRALLLSLGLVTLLYGLVHLVAEATLGPALVTSTVAPLADAAGILAGSPFRTLMLLGTLFSMLGYLSAVALASPRTLFALSGGGIFPVLERATPSHTLRRHPRPRRLDRRCRVDGLFRGAGAVCERGGAGAVSRGLAGELGASAARRARGERRVQRAVRRARDRVSILHLAALAREPDGAAAGRNRHGRIHRALRRSQVHFNAKLISTSSRRPQGSRSLNSSRFRNFCLAIFRGPRAGIG
jgi:hypothetical protein